MQDAPFFMAIGALGVTLAGFAGLIAALGRPSPVSAWRIRNVVTAGFAIMFLGFGTVAVHAATQDESSTVRVITACMLLVNAVVNRRELSAGPAWPNEGRRRRAIGIGLLTSAVMVVNLALASTALLQLLLLFMLTWPVSIFRFAVAELTQREPAAPESR